MKKYILLFAIAALTSCTKDDIAYLGYETEDNNIISFTTVDEGSTRTSIAINDGDDNDEIVWQEGDRIGIYSPQITTAANYLIEVNSSNAGKRNATFTTDLKYASSADHTFYAYYPYASVENPRYLSNSVTGNLVPSQDGSIAANAFMWAKAIAPSGSKNVALEFKHPFTYLNVKLKSSSTHIGKKLQTLTFVAEEGKTLAGDYTLNFETGALNFTKTYNTVSVAADVTLSTEYQDLFLVINPADLADTEVKIIAVLKDGAGNVTTLKSTKTGKTFTAQTRTEMLFDIDVMTDASADPIPVADANFRNLLIATVAADPNITQNDPNEISFAEAQQIKSLVIGQVPAASAKGVTDDVRMVMATSATRAGASTEVAATQGVEFLTSLEEFVSVSNTSNKPLQKTVLDLSMNTKLKRIICENNMFNDIIFGDKPELEYLYLKNERGFCRKTNYLDLSAAPKLKTLICQNCSWVSEINLSNCPDLEELDLYNSQILYLDVRKNTKLKVLKNTSPRFVGEIDVTHCPDLVELQFCASKTLKSLDVSKNAKLEILECGGNPVLGSIDVTNNPKLKKLNCVNIGLTTLDVSKNPLLEVLNCNNNSITTLDVSNNKALTHFYFDTNQITSSFDLRQHTELVEIRCHTNNISGLNTSGLTKVQTLIFDNNPNITSIDVSSMVSLQAIGCSGTGLTSLDVSACKELVTVDCENVSSLTSLTLNNPKLETLGIGGTGLKSVNISNCPALLSLSVAGTQFENTTLDLSQCTSLTGLTIDNTNVEKVVFSPSSPMMWISAVGASMSSLDFSCKTTLKQLTLGHNPNLVNLDLREFTALQDLNCRHTQGKSAFLKTVDVSGLANLQTAAFLYCSTLEEVNVSNTQSLKQLIVTGTSVKKLDVSTTGLNGKTLSCKTPTLKTLILGNSSWRINYIYPTRNASYIDPSTEIVFADEM